MYSIKNGLILERLGRYNSRLFIEDKYTFFYQKTIFLAEPQFLQHFVTYMFTCVSNLITYIKRMVPPLIMKTEKSFKQYKMIKFFQFYNFSRVYHRHQRVEIFKHFLKVLGFFETHFLIKSCSYKKNVYFEEISSKVYKDRFPCFNCPIKNFYIFHLFKTIFFSNWDSLHTRLNSHYKAWKYKKKKHKKIKAYRKSIQKEPTVQRCLLILDLKPFRSQVKGKHSIGREFQNLSVRGKELLTQTFF